MKNDIVNRFSQNPVLRPSDFLPSHQSLEVTGLFNPGAFEFNGKTWLIVRVAERAIPKPHILSFPVLRNGRVKIIDIAKTDPQPDTSDPRVINYKGANYLTTLSHLRLLCSDDGVYFYEPEGYPLLQGEGILQGFGIEDCRVSKINDTYYLTFTAVSENGVGIGLRTTTDWKSFTSCGMIFPPHNKDCTIFEDRINGKYYALHRPSGIGIGGNYIWLAESPDAIHWGHNVCLAKTRKKMWDSERVGAGAAPVKTEKGWLEIYHGANEKHQYALGALLLDLHNPTKVIARSREPIMFPSEPYELTGFMGNVIFTNGHIVKGDDLIMYYGAADEVICMATLSISQVLATLNV